MRRRTRSRSDKRRIIATLAVGLALVGAPSFAQTSEYYLHSGDQAAFSVIRGGSLIRRWSTAVGTDRSQNLIAVRRTVRTTGSQIGRLGAEYNLDGRDLGSRYEHPSGAWVCWDGATDGAHHYAIDTSGGIYRFSLDWSEPVLLFSVEGLGSLTYDPDGDSLWVAVFSGSTFVTEYSLDGRALRSFSTGHERSVALAMDYADRTLWLHDYGRRGTFEQWSRTGDLLQTVTVAEMTGQNALAGEFAFSTGRYSLSIGGRCPGTVRLVWDNAPADTRQGVLFARSTGRFTIHGGPCEGTRLGLGADHLQLAAVIGTGSGSGAINRRAGPGACRGHVQLVALDQPCPASNVVRLPW